MWNLISDPRAFSWLIMGLYAINSTQYLFRGCFYGAAYWAGALLLTFCAMHGFNR